MDHKDKHYTCHCRQLRNEVDVQSQRVRELESYLGGEIPGEDLRRGVTWKEERETLVNTLQVSSSIPAW